MIKLTKIAAELSAYGITASFCDAAGDAVVPTAITWSLTDLSGAVINSRKDVAVSVLAPSVTIVLRGDDLQLVGDATRQARLLVVTAVYDDTVLGDDCPVREEIRFIVGDRVEAE